MVGCNLYQHNRKKKNKMQSTFEDFIGIFDESISNQLCNTLVEWFDFCAVHNFTARNMKSGGERSDEVMFFPPIDNGEMNTTSVYHTSIPTSACNEYWKKLNICYNEYKEKYNLQHRILSSYAWKIHKVKPGEGFHRWHAEQDNNLTTERVLVFMTYLKCPEEGGETEFLYQKKRIEPIVGKTLIWPAHFTHLHRGNPPLKGIKYYLTGWFESERGYYTQKKGVTQ